jgi:hypothetical protein
MRSRRFIRTILHMLGFATVSISYKPLFSPLLKRYCFVFIKNFTFLVISRGFSNDGLPHNFPALSRIRPLSASRLTERIERGGPCWLMKLRWIGSQRVQMQGVLPCLVRLACLAGFFLPWLLLSAQYKIFCSSPYTIFNSFVPIAHQSEQAAELGRLSLSMVLLLLTKFHYKFSW